MQSTDIGVVVGMKIETNERGEQIVIDPGIRYTREEWNRKCERDADEKRWTDIKAQLDRIEAMLARMTAAN